MVHDTAIKIIITLILKSKKVTQDIKLLILKKKYIQNGLNHVKILTNR